MSLQDKSLTLVEHLAELRNRIIFTLFFFIVGMVIGFVFATDIIQFLIRDMGDLNVFRPLDTLRVYMQIAVYVGIVAALPMALYQVWAFVKPALTPLERKNTGWFIPVTVVLFILGACFAYFIVFKFSWKFLMGFTENLGQVENTIGLQEVVSFIVNLILPFGLLFEMPVIVIFLTKIRILNPVRMRGFRKNAYLMLVLLSVIITPPDFISPLIVYFPLIALYEISVMLSARIYKRQLAVEAEAEAQFAREQEEKAAAKAAAVEREQEQELESQGVSEQQETSEEQDK